MGLLQLATSPRVFRFRRRRNFPTRRAQTAPSVQPQAARRGWPEMQGVPPERRSGRDDGLTCGFQMHGVSRRDREGQASHPELETASRVQTNHSLGSRLSDSELCFIQPSIAPRKQRELPGMPRAGGRARGSMARRKHHHGRLYGLPPQKSSQPGLRFVSRISLTTRFL